VSCTELPGIAAAARSTDLSLVMLHRAPKHNVAWIGQTRTSSSGALGQDLFSSLRNRQAGLCPIKRGPSSV